MKTSSAMTRLGRLSRLRPFLLPGLILAIGLGTTAGLWSMAREHEREHREQAVEQLAGKFAGLIEERFRDNVQLLRGAAGLFDAPEWITHERFRRYFETLSLQDQYPGIQGIGFLLLIPEDEKDARVAAVHREGLPQFQIRPDGERAFYAAVLYIERFSGRNLRSFGFDMAAEPQRWAAATRARDQAAAALSARVTLAQEGATDIQPGVVLFLPVYRAGAPHDSVAERRANLLGWVYSPLRMHDLMQDVLRPVQSDLAQPGLRLDVHDGDRPTPETRLFTSALAAVDLPSAGTVRKTQLLEFAGHQWSLVVTAGPLFKSAFGSGLAAWIGLGGLTVSLLLALFAAVQTQARRRVSLAMAALERTNQHLAEQEHMLLWAQRNAQLGSWTFDPSTGQPSWSEGVFRIWGLDPKQGPPDYAAHRRYIHPDDWVAFDQAVRRALEQGEPYELRLRIRRPDGEERTLITLCTPHRDAHGKVVGLSGTNQDVTERDKLIADLRRKEKTLRVSRDRLIELVQTRKALIDSLPANIALLDTKGDIVEVNDRWLRFGEQNADDDRDVDLGRNYLTICDEANGECADEAPAVAKGLRQVVAGERDTFELEYPCHAPDQQRWFRLSATRLGSDKRSDAPVGIAVMHVDITERKQAELKLEHIAYHDPLTGVLSLNGLTRGIAQRLSADASNPDAMLVMLDVRSLRDVNDAQGYAVGDQLLIDLGRRLQEQVGPQGLVGRVGGDEFGLFLRLQPGQEPHQRAAEVSALAEQPFHLEQLEVSISIEIGYTLIGNRKGAAEELLREAELALYEQRATKLSAPVAYTQALGRHVRERVEMAQDLRMALEQGQLELHFQPKVDLRTGKLIACEALLRWNHPERGLQPPPEFIPVAEQSQLIVPIGDWVLREACRHLHQWRSEGLDVVRVAVNVSLTQLALGDFPQRVRACLDEFDVAPSALTLEITESVFERESLKLLRQLQQLQRMGIRLSLDDFGTGYSSLVYLQKYPFDEIKVDRAFVSQVLDDAYSREVVSSVLGLATAIGAEVVAEGIESNAVRDELVKLGCRIGQGYYFSVPLEVEDFRWLLQQHKGLPLGAAASG